MLPPIPLYVDLIFIFTAVLTIWLLFRASGNKAVFLLIPLTLGLIEAIAAKSGFFTHTSGLPPRLVFAPAIGILLIVVLFITNSGRSLLQSLNLRQLTLLHVVRIPVELVLYMLFLHKSVPELMTFAGSNPDILSGITAPLAVLIFIKKGQIKRLGLILWNLACLALLANIVAHAALSVPSEIQKFGFEQPNIAILHFPYIWLPGIVVPIVLLSHLAALRILILQPKSQ